MNREDVIGITLAELTLVLLFIFIIIFFVTSSAGHDNQALKEALTSQEDLIAMQLEEIAALKSDRDRITESHAREIDRRSQTIERLTNALSGLRAENEQLRSKFKPSCYERGYAPSVIGSVLILGADRYSIAGKETDIAGIRKHFAKELTTAEAVGCVQTIRTNYSGKISLDEYYAGLRKLERLFYISKGGKLETGQ